MNTKSKIAAAALIISAFASPVFAAQQGVGADPITDGRYSPELMLSIGHRAGPSQVTIRAYGEDNAFNQRLATGHN